MALINKYVPLFRQFGHLKKCNPSFPLYNIIRHESDDCQPTFYDLRKYGHYLPCNNVTPSFYILPDIPSGVFRNTSGEVLGCTRSGASKEGCYKNPEYFSYQHMSYYDFHLHFRKYRLPSADTKRKPP